MLYPPGAMNATTLMGYPRCGSVTARAFPAPDARRQRSLLKVWFSWWDVNWTDSCLFLSAWKTKNIRIYQ